MCQALARSTYVSSFVSAHPTATRSIRVLQTHRQVAKTRESDSPLTVHGNSTREAYKFFKISIADELLQAKEEIRSFEASRSSGFEFSESTKRIPADTRRHEKKSVWNLRISRERKGRRRREEKQPASVTSQ